MKKPAAPTDTTVLDEYQAAYQQSLAADDRQWGDRVFGRVLAGVAGGGLSALATAATMVLATANPAQLLGSPVGKAVFLGTVVAGVAGGAWKLGNALMEESREKVDAARDRMAAANTQVQERPQLTHLLAERRARAEQARELEIHQRLREEGPGALAKAAGTIAVGAFIARPR